MPDAQNRHFIPTRSDASVSRGRRASAHAAAFVTLLLLAGCALRSPDAVRQSFLLVGFTPDTSVRPGDPVIIETVLVSQYRKPVTLPVLNASTVDVWFVDESGRTFKRDPVVTPLEDQAERAVLEPGERWRRRFLVTQATETSGSLTIKLVYGGGMSVEAGLPDGPVAADPIPLLVRGPRSFHRDSSGVLMKDDAVEVARTWSGFQQGVADAVLVRNEVGFLDWWVRLTPSGAQRPSKACLVNPYLGDVRAEVDPALEPPVTRIELKGPPIEVPPQPLKDTTGMKMPERE